MAEDLPWTAAAFAERFDKVMRIRVTVYFDLPEDLACGVLENDVEHIVAEAAAFVERATGRRIAPAAVAGATTIVTERALVEMRRQRLAAGAATEGGRA